MLDLAKIMLPELVLLGVACVLFLLGATRNPSTRRLAASMGIITLVLVFVYQVFHLANRDLSAGPVIDASNTFHTHYFSDYIKIIASAVGVMLMLLAYPSRADGTGNSAIDYGQEGPEFFALMLLSIAGIFLVVSANDIILLFLGIELASIPTYIMVSISRPLPVAQEAGVKYFFLGAMAAAIMLFGFSYLYGTTGTTRLDAIGGILQSEIAHQGNISPWQMLAVVLLISGFGFKIAAVPLHFYAGDVYQGAATPVTAFLSFVPKTSGFIALIKVLYAVGGDSFIIPHQIKTLLWVLAALTMTFGNVLGLMQYNIKRVFAYSSIAHSGYMLAGLTAMCGAAQPADRVLGLQGVLFYLAAYGIMNTGAFGVLMLLPARNAEPGASAETFEEIAGQGRRHIGLGLAMAVSCFSLIGIPLTVGFLGKFLLLQPLFAANMVWLPIILVANAAISAAYYLRIVATLFLRPEAADAATLPVIRHPLSVTTAIALSVGGALVFGIFPPATNLLSTGARQAADLEANLPGKHPMLMMTAPPTVRAAAPRRR